MLRGRPILLITRMITDRIGLHSVQLPLLIITIPISEKKKQQQQQIHLRKTSPVVKMSNKKFGNFPVFFFKGEWLLPWLLWSVL